MDKEMSRGDTMLISIDAPTEYPVTTLLTNRPTWHVGRGDSMTIEQIIDRIRIMNKYHLLATQYSEMWKRYLL